MMVSKINEIKGGVNYSKIWKDFNYRHKQESKQMKESRLNMAGRLNWTTVGGETREGPVTKRGGLGQETRVAKIVELFIRLRKEKRKPRLRKG